MKLLEYEAKALLAKDGISVPKSYIAHDVPEFLPAVLKSQVPVGGRGKAGGIVIAKDRSRYRTALEKLPQLEIKGFRPHKILAEELIDIASEYYLSLLIDKAAGQIIVMANINGGVEVEDNPEDSFWTHPVHGESDFDQIGQNLADYLDLPDKTFVLQEMIKKLYLSFVTNDALLCEINPLILTAEGRILAGDCKMELDDAAVWRHDDWDFEAEKREANFVTLDENGFVATVANGAGLAMATVDAAADAGLVPANFLDIGGGANEASVLAAFKRLVEYPNVKVIIINIFAGITRCDEVARAIIAAREQLPNLPPLAVRLAGTNYDEAARLLSEYDIVIQPSLEEAIESAREELS